MHFLSKHSKFEKQICSKNILTTQLDNFVVIFIFLCNSWPKEYKLIIRYYTSRQDKVEIAWVLKTRVEWST